MKTITLLLALILAFSPGKSAEKTDPRYWIVSLDSLAIGHVRHTHIETRGQVAYTRLEDDGDLHIRLANPLDSTHFFIAECIPRMPCTRPRAGADIIIRGIFRRDPEHSWYEIHPVDSWYYATAGE